VRLGLLGTVWLLTVLAAPVAAQIEPLQAEPLPTMVEVRQSGGFDLATLSLIDDAVRAVRADSTELHRVTLRMLRVTRGDEVVQEAPSGFGYPMLTMAIDPATPVVPVDLRTTLSRGEAAMGEITARLRGAEVGDVIDLESLDGRVVSIRIGAIVPDEKLRWSEILIGASVVPGLEFDRPYAVVAWGHQPGSPGGGDSHMDVGSTGPGSRRVGGPRHGCGTAHGCGQAAIR